MRSHVRTGGSVHMGARRLILTDIGESRNHAENGRRHRQGPSLPCAAPPRGRPLPRPARPTTLHALDDVSSSVPFSVLPVLLAGRRGRLVRSGQDRFCRSVLRPREEADSRAPGRGASERERIFALQTTVDVGRAASGPAAVDCGSDSGEPRGVEGACGNRRVRSRAEREPEGVPQVRQELDEVGLIAGMDV